MPLVVQNNQGTVDEANSYITLEEFKAYHDDRGGDYSAFTDTQIEQALVRATDYIDRSFTFLGYQFSVDQSTEWPRSGLYNRVNTTYVDIPREIKEATCVYAIISLNQILNPIPERDNTGAVVKRKKVKAGPVEEEIEYFGGGSQMPSYPEADDIIYSSGFAVLGGRLIRG